jgi:hypothetical protein
VKAFRTFLLGTASLVALTPGMIAATERAKVKQIEDWIAAHPEQARQLSKQVEAGKYGDLRA